MTTCSHIHEPPLRTARVARSYWRCTQCGANHGLDVHRCTQCSGAEDAQGQPPLRLGVRHWVALVGTWAAATVLWAAVSGLFAGRS